MIKPKFNGHDNSVTIPLDVILRWRPSWCRTSNSQSTKRSHVGSWMSSLSVLSPARCLRPATSITTAHFHLVSEQRRFWSSHFVRIRASVWSGVCRVKRGWGWSCLPWVGLALYSSLLTEAENRTRAAGSLPLHSSLLEHSTGQLWILNITAHFPLDAHCPLISKL